MLQLFRRPALLTAFATLIGALVLFWLVRRAPLTLAGPVTLDAPTAFLALVIALGATMAIESDPHTPARAAWGAQLPVLLFLPLIRIFAVGPIHTALLVLISLSSTAWSLWLARSMFLAEDPTQQALAARRFFLAIALSSLGLASSAGGVAACAALLCYAVLSPSPPALTHGWQRWAIAGALPFSAPFVAAWLAIGAATAAGATALAAALWLAAVLRMVAVLVAEPQNRRTAEPQNRRTAEPQNQENKGTKEQRNKSASNRYRTEVVTLSPCHLVTLSIVHRPSSIVHRPSSIGPTASITLGVLAPPVVALLIQPVVAQLQAGLTPYGNLSVSPWIGLALLDSGSRGVITAPLLAGALLMVVIGALVSLFYRSEPQNRRTAEPQNQIQPSESSTTKKQTVDYGLRTTNDDLLATLLLGPAAPNLQSPATLSPCHLVTLSPCLIESVPWLALLVGKRSRHDLR